MADLFAFRMPMAAQAGIFSKGVNTFLNRCRFSERQGVPSSEALLLFGAHRRRRRGAGTLSMNKERQLALVHELRETLNARDTGVALAVRDTIMAQFDRERVLIPAQQSATTNLAQFGKMVLKIDTEFHSGDMRFNQAKNTISYPKPVIRTFISVASEGDILDAQRNAEQNGSGAERVQLRKFLELVRATDEQPQQPLRIEIVNPETIGTGVRVLSVKRDDAGKMTGAVVASP